MATTHDMYRAHNHDLSEANTGGMINALLWVLFGGLAGWIGSLIVGADASLGIVGNVIVGIVGAFLGGFIADRIGMGGAPGAERPTSFASFVWAIIGAVLLLPLVNFFAGLM